LLVCVGSHKCAPELVPQLARNFNTVDSFDTHDKLREYIASIKSDRVNIVATGWDPGLFSLMRIYFDAFMHPQQSTCFWGPGVSLGHTNALRAISGVQDAIQFTVPVIKEGRHRRECYVVADPSIRARGDLLAQTQYARIEHEIRTMPNYFAGQDVTVNFIDQRTFNRRYRNRTDHGGTVIACDNQSRIELKLRLKSNPHFTAQVMLAYAIANYHLQRDGIRGVFTVADVAPKYLSLDDVLSRI